jgi:putative ABC transport system substrate-binding protein
MNRRAFILLLGGAAAWPLATHAQQPMPVIGYLGMTSRDATADNWLRGFREGLKETSHVEGQNVAIDYLWAENRPDRLPALVAELVHRQVAVIATPGGPAAAMAAKVATTTIPIVFIAGEDPVRLGLVTSLARPGGNLTGINFLSNELIAKRLELLRELVPTAKRIAVLVNPANVAIAEPTVRDIGTAAHAMGLQIRLLNADNSGDIDAAFATFAHERPDALFVASTPLFHSRRVQLVHLATRYAIPAIYALRDYAEVGGLITYGASLTDAFRQLGIYTGRILKGMRPTDLPVVQSTKFEFVINAQTARTLGIDVPPSLLARADEVIE